MNPIYGDIVTILGGFFSPLFPDDDFPRPIAIGNNFAPAFSPMVAILFLDQMEMVIYLHEYIFAGAPYYI